MTSSTRSYFSEGNSASFPEGYIKSEKGWDVDILRMRSPLVWGDLCKWVALRRTDPLSCQSLGTLNVFTCDTSLRLCSTGVRYSLLSAI